MNVKFQRLSFMNNTDKGKKKKKNNKTQIYCK